MDDGTFWGLIARLDWGHEGDDDRVVDPLVRALADMPDSEIASFQNLLAARLYALDGQEWARHSGDDVWPSKTLDRDALSVDGFLYARCAVVARGGEHYEAVLADPSLMPRNAAFEPLLYIASSAYERRTGLDDQGELDMTDVSFETFSNADGWPEED